jgi:hypothetical protein
MRRRPGESWHSDAVSGDERDLTDRLGTQEASTMELKRTA